MKNTATVADAERTLLDTDGENRALRSFLMQYGVPGLTVAAMGQHMRRSGWESNYWPDFARQVDTAAEHLTKAGAQIWIRHLLSMEPRAAAPVGADVAASVLLKLCDQLDAMKLHLRAIPGDWQRESYYVADDVNCYVEQARAALAGAPAETVKAATMSPMCERKTDSIVERAVFEAWAATEGHTNFYRMAGNPRRYDDLKLRSQFKAWQAARATAPVGADVAADELPSLPIPIGSIEYYVEGEQMTRFTSGFDSNQMRGYAIDYANKLGLAPAAGAPAETVKPATFAPGDIVRKKSGSQWGGAIVGTYSSSITPEGYAVESSTHRGSVQIYPVGALELVTKGNV